MSQYMSMKIFLVAVLLKTAAFKQHKADYVMS